MSLSNADSENLRLAIFVAIADVLDIPLPEVLAESNFLTDFGANSLDIVNLIWHIEEKFSLPEASESELEALNNVQDLVDLVLRKAGPDALLERSTPSDSTSFAIASDHAGIALKALIVALLKNESFEVKDLGPNNSSAVDYPRYAQKVGSAVQSKQADFGILICGTGIGMSIAANKMKGVRAALCADPVSAKFTRLHNDANILCLGARTIGQEVALECVRQFINTDFAPGDDQRHQRRLNLIADLESLKK